MNKGELRKTIRARKRVMTEAEIQRRSQALCRKFLQSAAYRQAGTLYGYLPYNQEVRILPILEQALADGAFGLALGLPLHLGVPPFITGSKLVTKVLTEDMVSLTGGRVIIDGDGKSAANTLEAIIEEKRKALNI